MVPPGMKGARSTWSISNGVMHLIPSPIQSSDLDWVNPPRSIASPPIHGALRIGA